MSLKKSKRSADWARFKRGAYHICGRMTDLHENKETFGWINQISSETRTNQKMSIDVIFKLTKNLIRAVFQNY